MFSIGDVVICVDCSHCEDVSKGSIYTIIDVMQGHINYVRLTGDVPEYKVFSQRRFMLYSPLIEALI